MIRSRLPERHLGHRRLAGSCRVARARGVALIVGLVLLVLLALIATTAYSIATQEERMAGNSRDHARAFQAAEAALRECERIAITAPAFDPIGATAPGMYVAPAAPVVVNNKSILWNGDADVNGFLALTSPAIAAGVAGQTPPRCIAESFDPHLPHAAGRPQGSATMHVARVTALGFGINSATRVRLVSYVSFYQ